MRDIHILRRTLSFRPPLYLGSIQRIALRMYRIGISASNVRCSTTICWKCDTWDRKARICRVMWRQTRRCMGQARRHRMQTNGACTLAVGQTEVVRSQLLAFFRTSPIQRMSQGKPRCREDFREDWASASPIGSQNRWTICHL